MTPLRASNRRLTSLLLLVTVPRILLALAIWAARGPAGFHTTDTSTYVSAAQSMLHGAFLDMRNKPAVLRTPGYPLTLVPAVASGHLEIVAFLTNLCFTLLSAFLIWRIARELWPGKPAAAAWAVALYALEPVGLLNTPVILSDTFFCSLLLLCVWQLIRYLAAPRYRALLLCALTLACATYARPISTYLGPCLAVFLAVFPGTLTARERVFRAIAFQATFILALAPWIVRNSIAADYPSFSSAAAENLYFNSAGSIRARLQHITLDQLLKTEGKDESERYFAAHPEQRTWSRGQIFRHWQSEALRTISQHPLLYTWIHAKGCAVVLFDPAVTVALKAFRLYPERGGLLSRALDQGFFRATLWLFRNYSIAILVLPFMMALLIAYYLCAVRGLKELPLPPRCLFLVIGGYLILVSGMPGANARYRLPVMPLVSISAGAFLAKRSQAQAIVPASR